MLKKILPFLPLILPTLLYILYALSRRWSASASGAPLPPPWWETAPWPWLVGAGIVCVIVSLALWIVIGGVPTGGDYVPPALSPEGGVEPGRFAPAD